MSLETDFVAVLRHDPIGRINFRVESISISKVEMELVAKAIEAGDIAVETKGTGDMLGAAYSSFVSRAWTSGEKRLIGSMTMRSAADLRSAIGKAGAFHESVHALKDVQGAKGPMYKLSMHNEEVVAYLADAMYLRATRASFSGDAAAMAIYRAAFAIVDGRKMLARHRVTVTWNDCDALLKVIKANPAY